jgi:glycosyltransferase involved in cell wall biosynthesis
VRIIHLGEVAGLGGLQNWICSLAEAQKRLGFDVHLMQPPWVADGTQVFTSIPVHTWDLKKVGDFDIIHSHGCSGFQDATIRKNAGKAIVHSYYGTIVGIQIALRWFQNFIGWNGLGIPRNILREAIGGRTANAVIANSPKVRSEIIRFYGVLPRKISVIPAGFTRHMQIEDTQKKFLRQKLNLPEGGFMFLFVGRPDPVKNLPTALAAFRLVRSRFQDSFLVLAPNQLSPTGEGTIGVELPPDRMSQLYRAADALIHPGFYEAYSVAIHEALAHGLPSIIGRNTGNADYCTDEVDALILPRKRGALLIDALSRLMCSVIESDDLRSRLSKEAARKFGSMDWDWVAAETEKVYSSV